MVRYEAFYKELVGAVMLRATMEEKQERLDVLTAKYQGLFEFVGISEVTIEMHPRMITIGCKHNSQTTTYTTFGVFVRKFSPSVIMDYNRIITINNIIDE